MQRAWSQSHFSPPILIRMLGEGEDRRLEANRCCSFSVSSCGLNPDRIRVPRGWRWAFGLSYPETPYSVFSLMSLVLQWNGSSEINTERMQGRLRQPLSGARGQPTFLVQSTKGRAKLRERKLPLLVVHTHGWVCRILGEKRDSTALDVLWTMLSRDWKKDLFISHNAVLENNHDQPLGDVFTHAQRSRHLHMDKKNPPWGGRFVWDNS